MATISVADLKEKIHFANNNNSNLATIDVKQLLFKVFEVAVFKLNRRF